MDNKDPFARVMGSFEIGGKRFYKVYFLVEHHVLDKLLFLVDVFGDVDRAIEGSVNCAYKQFAGVLPSEEKALEESRLTEKELSELKSMIKRLESRIKEIVSSIISSSGVPTASPEVPVRPRRRPRGVEDVEMPDLVEVKEDTKESSEEPSISLEDAIAQAIVVAIDEELSNVISSGDRDGGSGGEDSSVEEKEK